MHSVQFIFHYICGRLFMAENYRPKFRTYRVYYAAAKAVEKH